MKRRTLAILSIASLMAMSLWFSGSAVIPQLIAEWHLSPAQQSWMTITVQLGFAAGALFSALLNLGDRIPVHRLFAVSAFLGAAVNGFIPLLNPGLFPVYVLRFFTGFFLAGVYPPGMKLIASWCKEDRGFGIGLLIAALTFGKAIPHLLNAVLGEQGMPSWQTVFFGTSTLSALAGILGLLFLRQGPHLGQASLFDWRFAAAALKFKPARLANFGYLGHMWELYAMWTWVPLFLLASYENAQWDTQLARFAGFAVIAVGSIGCIAAGLLADRIGRTTITVVSLITSGMCCIVVGFFFDQPLIATGLCLIWGFAVVADSAQFSAAVSELSDPRYVGTALTIQTCLGFLLTFITIGIVPPLVQRFGWDWVFCILAIGPLFGIHSMLRLRQLPDATRMASGNK